jgi:hypothetical protein
MDIETCETIEMLMKYNKLQDGEITLLKQQIESIEALVDVMSRSLLAERGLLGEQNNETH